MLAAALAAAWVAAAVAVARLGPREDGIVSEAYLAQFVLGAVSAWALPVMWALGSDGRSLYHSGLVVAATSLAGLAFMLASDREAARVREGARRRG